MERNMEQAAAVCEMATQVWSCLSDLKDQQKKKKRSSYKG